MSDNAQMDAIKRYARLIEKQTGKAVRPYRMDGYVNLMNRYGTSKDHSEHYNFQREPDTPDDVLTTIYEGNGLFAKIIDTPAEEAIKHGFTLRDVSDKAVEDFVTEALDELDWEELAMTAIRWTRLFGGAIAVMLINDGGRLEDPLNWRKIKSIDDIRVYERVVVQPEYESMFNYDPTDPFSTRGSRLGMPEYYQVCSRYGNFRVHDSRCLVFQNGVLPENATNSLYRLWGIPEYIRIHRALKDAELAHESAPKLLDRSVQAIYKMKGLSQLMATEQGESQVLRRLQVIDMARGMLNSLVIDSEGEDYDFKTFQFNGITDVVSASCNMLSAITSIPQTILFGQGVGGLSNTDDTSMENYYNYIERIQKRMLRKNLRYLLSIIFQAGLYTGEVDEVPKLNVEFNPLWSLNDTEQATLEQQKAATELTKAQTAQAYIQMEAIDPSEVRKGLADSDEFDVETLLDELDDGEEDLFSDMPDMEGGAGSQNPPESGTGPQKIFEPGHFADYAEGVDVKEHDTDPGKNGSPTPASAPAATKLPQDMSDEEKLKAAEAPTNHTKKPAINAQGDGNTTSLPDDEKAGVGVLVLKDGKVLVGTRESESGYGLICGPGGHIKIGEEPKQAAFRETEEEFGISPTELIPIGRGPAEPDTGIKPHVFLCTEYHGDLHCVDGEMKDPKFLSLEEIEQLKPSLFQPFMDGVDVLKSIINGDDPDPDGPDHDDGGPGSGNHGHEGRPGEIGGSAQSSATVSKETANSLIQKVNTSKSGTVIQISANGNGLFRDNGDTAELRVVRNKHSVEKLVDINTGKEYTTADVLMQVIQSQSNDFDLLSDESQCPKSVDAYSGGKDAFAEEAFSKERKKNAQKCYGAVESEIAYGDVAKNVAENASPEQKYAAFMYMANSSSINGMLRGERLNSNLEEMCKKTSDDLASLIEKSSYNSDIYVQRGITAKGLSAMLGCDEPAISTRDEDALKKTAVGTEYTEKAFTSAGAAMGTGLTGRDVQMSIYCPKGTKMLYMNKAVGADDEAQNEMLLQKGTSYKVTGIKRLNDGKIMVDAEVIGQAEDFHNGDGGPGSGNHGNDSRKTDGNVYSSENPIDFQAETDTITSKNIINDGAPKGNDNAAGPHKRSHLSSSDKAKYRNRIVGQKTSDGVQVKGFSNHAFDRIAQRNLSPKRIEDMLRSQNVSPDKTYQNRRCYDVKGSRLVLDHTTGTIVTIEWRKQNR